MQPCCHILRRCFILENYENCIKQWDTVFSAEAPAFPQSKTSGNLAFDRGLQWLSENASSILDFGCGNGCTLFLCSLYGTKKHIGIDLSPQGIQNAVASARMTPCGAFRFECGSLEVLRQIASASMDAAILSNIIDNLYPKDADTVLTEIQRILRKSGKILLKLNPYITAEQIKEWKIRVINGNLLDDGMLLWNQTTAEWDTYLSARFDIASFEDIYYKEYDQYNRMYLLVNP